MIIKWIFYFVLFFSTQSFAKGGTGYDAGNGGLVLVCDDLKVRFQVNKIQFYDLWYWSDEGISEYPLTFRKDLPAYPQGVETLIQEFAEMLPKYSIELKEEHKILDEKIKGYLEEFRQGYHYNHVSRTKDYGGRLSPKNFCNPKTDYPLSVANIARYDQNNFFVLSALYFMALSEDEKNALIFHEVVYRVLEKHNLDKGEAFNTMDVTAHMMSTLSRQEKLTRLQKIFN